MQKIINSHCHIYPEKIASRAVVGIKDFYDFTPDDVKLIDYKHHEAIKMEVSV